MLLFGVNNTGVSGVGGVRRERNEWLRCKRKTCVDPSLASSLIVGVAGSFLLCSGRGGNGGNSPLPIGSGVGSMLLRSNGRIWAGDLSEPPGWAWGTLRCKGEGGDVQPPLL